MSSKQSSIKTIVPGSRSLDEIYEDEAHQIVDEAIDNAIRRLMVKLESNESRPDRPDVRPDETRDFGPDGIELPKEEDEETIDPETGKVLPNIKWMSADTFTVAGGLEKVEEFIQTWERDSSWLHCIDFLREEDHPYSKRYRFAVKWSVPTRRKPIPRATASVYFTLEVSKFKPKSFPIEVYYIFESHHLVHRPGKTKFREKWLKDIIESKIKLMGTVHF